MYSVAVQQTRNVNALIAEALGYSEAKGYMDGPRRVTDLVSDARNKLGFLTRTGQGKGGGALTAAGRSVLSRRRIPRGRPQDRKSDRTEQEGKPMTKRNATAAPQKDPKTGTWLYVVDLGRGADGKRRQVKRRGFPTKKAAQEALNQVRHANQTTDLRPPRPKQTASANTFDAVARRPDGDPTPALDGCDGYRRRCLTLRDPGARRRSLDGLTPQGPRPPVRLPAGFGSAPAEPYGRSARALCGTCMA